MAMTHDYLDYLNENVGIAPSNSQEELQAAQTIAGLMAQHDLEPKIEEFDAPSISGLSGAVLALAMFVGVILSGIGVLPLTVVGFVLAIVPTVLGVLSLLGRPVSLSLGPTSRSQNVVACHHATGPLVTKGNRAIVVVAHYDSPHENFLYSSPVAPYLPLVTKVARWAIFGVGLCALIQVMGFIPEAGRRFFWVIGMLAALPSVLLAVAAVAERLAPCTLGANDNKSSVAALLGVLENVRPSGMAPKPRPVAMPADVMETEPEAEVGTEGSVAPAAADATQVVAPAEPAPAVPVMEEVVGVRHGEKVLRELGMLPEDCEIEYVEPAVVMMAPEPAAAPEASEAPAAETEPAEEPSPATEDMTVAFTEVEVTEVQEPDAQPSADAEVDVESEPTAVEAPVEEAAATTGDLGATREQLLSTGQFSLVMDDSPRGVGPKDSSGLTNTEHLDAELDATRPTPVVERPEAPADPEWGKSNFRPQLSDVARRASLFDLPDPSATGVDPFTTEDVAERVRSVQPATVRRPEPAPAPAPESVATMASETPDATKHSGVGGFFDRFKKRLSSHKDASASKDMPSSNSWLGEDEDDSEDGGLWRGGAATRGGLRLVGEDEVAEAPSEDELRDAVLSLKDDALISHDVWFVALGASSLDHAGMKAFLAQHRSEIRGSFVVNLDCVGAGNLSVITREGLEDTRRADRRMGRLLTNAANALHAPLAQHALDWTETDATPAMHARLRSVTLMGMGDNGLPALSRTGADVPNAVSGDQAAQVTQIVTEMIRRS